VRLFHITAGRQTVLANARIRRDDKLLENTCLFDSICVFSCSLCSRSAQAAQQTSRVVRLDGGNCTYAFGVNERGELQTLYWGGRLGSHDSIPPAHSLPSGPPSIRRTLPTPQEYAGWGAGLFIEPALKVSFVDGSRDLVLHLSGPRRAVPSLWTCCSGYFREIYVTLRYSMDPESEFWRVP